MQASLLIVKIQTDLDDQVKLALQCTVVVLTLGLKLNLIPKIAHLRRQLHPTANIIEIFCPTLSQMDLVEAGENYNGEERGKTQLGRF